MQSFPKILTTLALAPALAFANPAGEVVTHGAADFSRSGSSLQILQGTENVVIDWQSFSIGAGETTQFIQPGTSSAALNRVRGASASQIDGLLKANGRVFLINPNGIVIGRGGSIDVGGFVASSLDVSDADFLANGDMTFEGNANAGAVINLGSIRANDGDIFLFGPKVENAGTLFAPNGTVGLGAGRKVLLKASGSERVFVEGSGSVVNSGTVNANIAELKAHGGNVYAMAIKNTNRVVATGVKRSGGQIFLTGRGSKISNRGTLKATRSDGSGGKVKIDAGPTGEIKLEAGSAIDVESTSSIGGVIDLFSESLIIEDQALLDASGATEGGTVALQSKFSDISGSILAKGATGTGGIVTLEADQLTLGNGTLVDVSGGSGGGEIFAGGGFQGSNPDIQNAMTTTVADGAVLKANSTGDGNAGQVIVWADGDTDFAGAVEARALGGAGHGGFAEVSGKVELSFSGAVDLRGAGDGFGNGTLLLDPTDFTIGLAEATSITNSLNSGTSVVVRTSNAGAGNGDIFVNSAIITNPGITSSLALVAHRHIQVNESVQLDSSGPLQLIAGLQFTGSTFIISGVPPGEFLFGIADFGIDNGSGNGSVFVNNGAGGGTFARVSVGSRSGETGVYGFDINVEADALSTTGEHAMIGFFSRGLAAGDAVPGNIVVEAKNDIVLTPGANFNNPAQIGHLGVSGVGGGGSGNATGSISVNAGNDVILNVSNAGFSNNHTQIGHGGSDPFTGLGNGNVSGSISVTAGRNIALNGRADTTGGGDQPLVQIGHGGDRFNGTKDGNITLMAGGNISVTGGTSAFASDIGSFSLVGHGGNSSTGNITGQISVEAAGDVMVTGGRTDGFAQIGHFDDGTRTGNISVSSTGGAGTLTLQGGVGSRATARVGHGGSSSASGTIDVSGFSQISLTGGTGTDGDAQIGHGGSDTTGAKSGNITVSTTANGRLDLGTDASGGAAHIGHGGEDSEGSKTGDITINTFIGQMLTGAGRTQIGHASINEIGIMSGDITVNSDLVFNIIGGTTSDAFSQVGHLSNTASSSASGAIDLNVGGGIILQGGSDFNTTAQIGHKTPDNDGAISVDVTNAGGAIQVLGGGDEALIGHDASFVAASSSAGSITVNAAGNITVQGGSGAAQSVGQIGHQGQITSGNIAVSSDDLGIFSGGPVTAGRYIFGNFGKIGHGTDDITSATGNIDIATAGTTTVRAGTNSFDNFVQIGHGGREFSAAPKTGDITLNTGSLILEKPDAGTEYALIGHGSPSPQASPTTGAINIIAQDDITVTNAQIGHATGGQRFGNTFIGVGQSDPTLAGAGTLTANAASSFFSEPKDSNGELRFYAPTRDDVDIALGANLNTVPLASNDPYPNEQGFFLFGAGPYSGDFSFYFDFPAVVVPPAAPPVAPPLVTDPTGILLPDFSPDDDGPENDPFTVENEFHGDDGENDPFPSGDPEDILKIGGDGDTTLQQSNTGNDGGGFSADPGVGGFPIDFTVPDGLVTDGYGVVGFGDGDVKTAAAPPEVAAKLGEHLSDQAHVVTIPDGMVGPNNEVVSFGENSGIVETFDTAGKVLTGNQITMGSFVELGSAISGRPQIVPIPGGNIQNGSGAVGFSEGSGINAQMAPPEVAEALAEALGENAHDGSVRGPAVQKFGPNDGVASFGADGTQIPRTVEQDIDAVFEDALNAPAATAELEAAFGE